MKRREFIAVLGSAVGPIGALRDCRAIGASGHEAHRALGTLGPPPTYLRRSVPIWTTVVAWSTAVTKV